MLTNNVLKFAALLSIVSSCDAASLDNLLGRASLIVVGTVDTRAEGPTRVAFTINVARILKGTGAPVASVSVVHPWSGLLNSEQTLLQSVSGLWFLTQGAAGNFDALTARPLKGRTFASLFLPALASPPTGSLSYTPGTAVSDALVYEMTAGFQATVDDGPDTFLAALEMGDTPAIRSAWSTLSASSNVRLQAATLGFSLAHQLPGSIASLVQIWPSIRSGPYKDTITQIVRNTWQDSTPTEVQALIAFQPNP
jgi:hypothetical protein